MKTVLVTGGAGYIGSHVCKLLQRNGYLPVALDNLSLGYRHNVQWGPLVIGDIRDSAFLDKVFQEFRPDIVMHFAALSYVGESVSDPAKYYNNNVSGSLSLLEAMRRNGCMRIVFSSSCSVYGIPEQLPIHEGLSKNPVNPYGQTKLVVEGMLRDYHAAYGLQYVSLRYFNAAGADPEGELGEEHNPETHLIPLAVRAALGQGPSLSVFGTDYPTADGTAIRDYLHVNDIGLGHIKAIEYLLKGEKSDCFNLGTGTGYSVKQIIKAVEKIGKRPVPIQYAARRPGDPPALIALPARTNKVLGWSPVMSSLEQIVETAWRWHGRETS